VPSKDCGRQIVEGDPRLLQILVANIGHGVGGGVEVAHVETPIEIAREAASGPWMAFGEDTPCEVAERPSWTGPGPEVAIESGPVAVHGPDCLLKTA
jgi:hypothetical protein